MTTIQPLEDLRTQHNDCLAIMDAIMGAYVRGAYFGLDDNATLRLMDDCRRGSAKVSTLLREHAEGKLNDDAAAEEAKGLSELVAHFRRDLDGFARTGGDPMYPRDYDERPWSEIYPGIILADPTFMSADEYREYVGYTPPSEKEEDAWYDS